MHNVEFKAELRDPELARTICRGMSATFILDFGQVDTYYRVPTGRLKKRETDGESIEYIFYERANTPRPKLSHFVIMSEAQALARYGSEPLPEWLVVRKRRQLWLLGPTRIHLDSVENLGNYIEFESLVSNTNPVASAQEHVFRLRETFAPAMGEMIDCGYSDLLEREQGLHAHEPIEPRE